MSTVWTEPGLATLDNLEGLDALCLLVGSDERPLTGAAGFADWRLAGALSRVLRSGFFQAAPGEQLLMPSSGRLPVGRVFVLGVGPLPALDAAGLEAVLSRAAHTLRQAGSQGAALALPRGPELDRAHVDQAVTECLQAHFPGKLVVIGAEP